MNALTDGGRDWVLWLEDLVDGFTVVDWVLLALAVALAFWLWLTVRTSGELGPVELEALVHDDEGAAKPPVQELTALMRERLATAGLSPPPSVPAGAPQTDLIAAIDASSVPEGASIAKLLQMLPWPQPAAFKLSGTLHGPADGGSRRPRGVDIWLRPQANGRELLTRVSGTSFETIALQAADRVFMHISTEAVKVFPNWAQWTEPVALWCYLEGLELVDQGHLIKGRRQLQLAARKQPRNLLPRLQLLNLKERELHPIVGTDTSTALAMEHAELMRAYLDIAVEQPDLLAARFRASVLASTLASAFGADNPDARTAVAKKLGVESGQLSQKLRSLSQREAEASLQLSRGWYVPLRHLRRRHRYEPKGHERQQLHRALAISVHCIGVRGVFGSNARFSTVRLWRRRAVVWGFHLQLGRATSGWQAHYNAACFYGLLDLRETLMPAGPPKGPRRLIYRDGYAKGDRRRRKFRRAACRHLNRAVDQGEELAPEWIACTDPDLASLRTAKDRDWRLFIARLTVKDPPENSQPDRPWGSPLLRQLSWAAALLVAALVTAIDIADHGLAEPGAVSLLVVMPLALWRAIRATREADVEGLEPTD